MCHLQYIRHTITNLVCAECELFQVRSPSAHAEQTPTTTFHQMIHMYTHLYRDKNKIMYEIYIS